MTISYNWLKEYIDIPESPEEIGKVLTSTGLEVEHVHAFETVKGGLKGLVIGEVLAAVFHGGQGGDLGEIIRAEQWSCGRGGQRSIRACR